MFPKQINKLKCAFGNKYYTKLRLYITWESISTLVKTYILHDTQGMPGQSGSPGAPGAVGIKGSSGRPGSPGENGYTGMTGEQGPQGNPGIDGQEGEQGSPGAKGSKGATVRIYNWNWKLFSDFISMFSKTALRRYVADQILKELISFF